MIPAFAREWWARLRGRTSEAREERVEALPQCQKVIVHLQIGATLCDCCEDFDGAISAFNKALELDPQCSRAYFNLGCACRNKCDFYAALSFYKKAVAIEPDDTEAHTRIQALEGEILALREGMVFEPLALLLPQFFWRERLVPCVCA